MTYPRAVLTAWLLAVLLTCALAYDMAHAGSLSLDIKGGVAWPIRTTPDGTYWQQAYPHDTKLLTGAYGVGLSYQHTPTLSFQAHWLDMGTSRIKGRANSDENYDHKNHRCHTNCTRTYGYRATDRLQGGDLTATYMWERDGVRPFVKGGLALLYHRAIFRNENGGEDRFNGWIPELELGAGLAYRAFYLELDYFHGMNIRGLPFGGQNLPISTEQIALFAGINILLF